MTMLRLDTLDAPRTRSASSRPPNRAVAVWLFGICFMLLVMIALGGATRLTGSGLSIMEWDPIIGIVPPLSNAEWQRLFTLYQHIPQYTLVNKGFGLEGFKAIFWLEWTHRLWGRLTGLVFLVPLIWFVVRGQITRRLAVRLGLLFLLGGLQGAIGWFMVASGFEGGSVRVSAYRLTLHLVFAVGLYAAILWTALEQWAPPLVPVRAGVRRWLIAAACFVAVTIVAGGFVAGLKAGWIDNTFPLMGGRLVPEHYASLHPFLRNLTENLEAVQFDHRLLATATACLVLASALVVWRSSRPGGRPALVVMALLVGMQYSLGVATLLLVVPTVLATLHQAVAVLLLSSVLIALYLHRVRPLGLVQPAVATT